MTDTTHLLDDILGNALNDTGVTTDETDVDHVIAYFQAHNPDPQLLDILARWIRAAHQTHP
jgi:hypothetical protein